MDSEVMIFGKRRAKKHKDDESSSGKKKKVRKYKGAG